MNGWIKKRAPGLLLGLVFGLGVGWGAGWWSSHWNGSSVLSLGSLPLDAVSTDSSDLFAVATGPVGSDVEGVFFLDSITGELQCLVMHRRAIGGIAQFVAQYKKNVFEDLNLQGGNGKKVRLLMVTGVGNFIGSNRNMRLGQSVVYVVDAGSGKFVAYGIPWSSTAYAAGQPQGGPFITMAAGSIRQQNLIRE